MINIPNSAPIGNANTSHRVPLPAAIQEATGIAVNQHGEGYRAERCPFCESRDGFNVPGDREYFNCFACGRAGNSLQDLADQLHEAGNAAMARRVEEHLTRPVDENGTVGDSPRSWAAWRNPAASAAPLATAVDESRILAAKRFALEHYERVRREQADEFDFEHDGELTTVQYYLHDRRGHSDETLNEFRVGLADGCLLAAASTAGFTTEELWQAGLVHVNSDSDYWPMGVILFPHFEDGEISHFSQKDPTRTHSFQSTNAHRKPGCLWYNQDASHDATELVLVEGENDLLSVVGKAGHRAVMACNGSISRAQIDFLLGLPGLARLILCFDNDDAGRRYVRKVGITFRNRSVEVVEVHLPDGVNDIDEFLCQADDPEASFHQLLEDASPAPVRESRIVVDQQGHCYLYRTLAQDEDGERREILRPITNFLIEIVYRVRTAKGCERYVRLTNAIGEQTGIFRMEAGSMVAMNEFKKFVMGKGNFLTMMDAKQLNDLWEYHFDLDQGREIFEPSHIGYVARHDLWLFGNAAIKDDQVHHPNDEGVIWAGETGFQVCAHGGDDEDASGLPTVTILEPDAAEALLDRFLALLHENIGYNAYLVVGWVFATLFSHKIFSRFRCFPGLFVYGKYQCGKGTVGSWIMNMFGMPGTAARSFFETTITAMNRAFAGSSSMPVWFDEYRHDDRQSRPKYAFLRGVYDRTGAGKGVKDNTNRVRDVVIRGTSLISGEHLPPDPALRSRYVQVHLSRRERNDTPFPELERIADQLSAITVHWLRTMTSERIDELVSEIDALRQIFITREGWDQRTALVYAVVAASFLCIREDLEFLRWVIDHGATDREARERESPLVMFFGDLENLIAQGTVDGRYVRVDGRYVYLWHKGAYNVWQADHRRRTNDDPWPLEVLVDHLREEGCLTKQSVQKKLGGVNRRCLKIDLNQAPEVVRDLAATIRQVDPSGCGAVDGGGAGGGWGPEEGGPEPEPASAESGEGGASEGEVADDDE